jgi:hypothetical protein
MMYVQVFSAAALLGMAAGVRFKVSVVCPLIFAAALADAAFVYHLKGTPANSDLVSTEALVLTGVQVGYLASAFAASLLENSRAQNNRGAASKLRLMQ